MLKGQMTAINLLIIFVVLLLFMVLAPMMQNDYIEPAVAQMNSTPNDFTAGTQALMRLTPFILLVAIILTAIMYARQQPQSQY